MEQVVKKGFLPFPVFAICSGIQNLTLGSLISFSTDCTAAAGDEIIILFLPKSPCANDKRLHNSKIRILNWLFYLSSPTLLS
jgi:hypothetical protein